MAIHANLIDALQEVADRSFCEDVTITPLPDGTYQSEDDHGTAYAGDTVMWSYDGGMELPSGVIEWSCLHETYESYDEARHIEYNLPRAVETLREGTPVTFAYAEVDAYHDKKACAEHCGEDGCQEDMLAGWALLAF